MSINVAVYENGVECMNEEIDEQYLHETGMTAEDICQFIVEKLDGDFYDERTVRRLTEEQPE